MWSRALLPSFPLKDLRFWSAAMNANCDGRDHVGIHVELVQNHCQHLCHCVEVVGRASTENQNCQLAHVPMRPTNMTASAKNLAAQAGKQNLS
jgi:hypothetical protein